MGYIKPDLFTVLAVLPMFQATVFSGQVEDADVLDIADFFLQLLQICEYRKIGFQKSDIFNHSCFRYCKDGCLKMSDFLKSKFSIFTIGEH